MLPRIKPMMENVVRLHGFESRCASIRTTPLSVLDRERDSSAAERYGLTTSRVAAFKAPEPKEFVEYPGPAVHA